MLPSKLLRKVPDIDTSRRTMGTCGIAIPVSAESVTWVAKSCSGVFFQAVS